MEITIDKIVNELKENNNFYILTHKSPDGDTLGSAFALCYALQIINKNAKVLCNDEIPFKYEFLYKNIKTQDFKPNYIISVDVADTQLLGDNLLCYANNIDLCIDHHASNQHYARMWYVEENSAANAEIIYKILKKLNIKINSNIADCIYTGISTDTGCFRHTNATSRSYRIAANMIDNGANAFKINKIMFDTKSKARLCIEKNAIESLEFFCKNKCAVISVTKDELDKVHANESDCDGLSSIPRKIEGVLVGILIKEKEPNIFKISLRTDESIDASQICSKFGGGGHKCAAGCVIKGSLNQVKNQLIPFICETIGD